MSVTGYSLDNTWDQASQRLALLEGQLDPITQRRLSSLGVGDGWNCLEVGGGGGSVTRWLCDQVGPTGHVTATDIEPRLLEEIGDPRLEILRHDILANDLPKTQFDLVHARWLLHHLPQPEEAITRMVSALRPGGWIVLEEVDFFPFQTSNSQVYKDFMTSLTSAVVAASGGNCFWARALPSLITNHGLTKVEAAGDQFIVRGGSPWAKFLALTAHQIRDRIVIPMGSLSIEQFDAAQTLLDDDMFGALGGAGIAVWGQRPTDQ